MTTLKSPQKAGCVSRGTMIHVTLKENLQFDAFNSRLCTNNSFQFNQMTKEDIFQQWQSTITPLLCCLIYKCKTNDKKLKWTKGQERNNSSEFAALPKLFLYVNEETDAVHRRQSAISGHFENVVSSNSWYLHKHETVDSALHLIGECTPALEVEMCLV